VESAAWSSWSFVIVGDPAPVNAVGNPALHLAEQRVGRVASASGVGRLR
jgi:hypothetical protein